MNADGPDEPWPLTGSGRVGLVVMRCQPLTRGHAGLLCIALQDCDTVIVGLGSTQLARVRRHPFSFEQRRDMLRLVFGDALKTIPLVDIHSDPSTDEWVDYVLDRIRELALPEPTDYFTGSPEDARWYVNRFARLDDPATTVGPVTTHRSQRTGARLHVLDRRFTELPPAAEIRSMIERRNPEWQLYVPARICRYVDWYYPPELRDPIRAGTPPDAKTVPPGTRLIREDGTLLLRDDTGAWVAQSG